MSDLSFLLLVAAACRDCSVAPVASCSPTQSATRPAAATLETAVPMATVSQPETSRPSALPRYGAIAQSQIADRLLACLSFPETFEMLPRSISTSSPSQIRDRGQVAQKQLLQVHDRGEAVVQLQKQLQSLGYYQQAIDGRYGPQTQAAVIQFQAAVGLRQDGIVGPQTWAALAIASPRKSKLPPATIAQNFLPSVPSHNQKPVQRGDRPAHAAMDDAVTLASDPVPSESPSQLTYVKAQVLAPIGLIVLLATAGGFVLVVVTVKRLRQQWQLQTDDETTVTLSEWADATPRLRSPASIDFDQPVILRQSAIWSQTIAWSIFGITSFSIIWACGAQIDEAIPAQGQLEPKGAVKAIQAPVGGVVEAIHIQEGERVEQGEKLVSFDSTAAAAQLKAIQSIRAQLAAENQFYQTQINSSTAVVPIDRSLPIKPVLLTLAQDRATLIAENQLYQAELGQFPVKQLSPEQQARWQASQAERNSRIAAAQLEVEQFSSRLNQTQVQLANARKILATNQEITTRLAYLVEEGAYARLPYLQQAQAMATSQAEVDRLMQDEQRFQAAIAQAQAQQQNTVAASQAELLSQIAANEQQIAQIESELSKVMLENQKQMEELDRQISEIQQTLNYQELEAPINGIVFDLQPKGPGYVADSAEPILKIVPTDYLVAQVYIPNQDIGFVQPGMAVDVRMDAFPYQTYGDLKGEIVHVGSDVLPPDDVYPFYRFPAEIRLVQSSVDLNGQPMPLQSGMSLRANIKIRKRRVISLIRDRVDDKLDSLWSTR